MATLYNRHSSNFRKTKHKYVHATKHRVPMLSLFRGDLASPMLQATPIPHHMGPLRTFAKLVLFLQLVLCLSLVSLSRKSCGYSLSVKDRIRPSLHAVTSCGCSGLKHTAVYVCERVCMHVCESAIGMRFCPRACRDNEVLTAQGWNLVHVCWAVVRAEV